MRFQNFDNNNVVKFYGMVLANEKNEVWIAMELMHNSLDRFFHETKYIIPLETQIKILTDVAQGMEHVAKSGFVHRDIACRNILYSFKNIDQSGLFSNFFMIEILFSVKLIHEFSQVSSQNLKNI